MGDHQPQLARVAIGGEPLRSYFKTVPTGLREFNPEDERALAFSEAMSAATVSNLNERLYNSHYQPHFESLVDQCRPEDQTAIRAAFAYAMHSATEPAITDFRKLFRYSLSRKRSEERIIDAAQRDYSLPNITGAPVPNAYKIGFRPPITTPSDNITPRTISKLGSRIRRHEILASLSPPVLKQSFVRRANFWKGRLNRYLTFCGVDYLIEQDGIVWGVTQHGTVIDTGLSAVSVAEI